MPRFKLDTNALVITLNFVGQKNKKTGKPLRKSKTVRVSKTVTLKEVIELIKTLKK